MESVYDLAREQAAIQSKKPTTYQSQYADQVRQDMATSKRAERKAQEQREATALQELTEQEDRVRLSRQVLPSSLQDMFLQELKIKWGETNSAYNQLSLVPDSAVKLQRQEDFENFMKLLEHYIEELETLCRSGRRMIAIQ
eukprot:Clim_evm38s156 gene=Clim_evmTU38s156